MIRVRALIWTFFSFAGAVGVCAAQDSPQEFSLPTLLEVHRAAFGITTADMPPDAVQKGVQLPPVTAKLLYANGQPAADVAVRARQQTMLGFFFPDAAFASSDSRTDANGFVKLPVHTQCQLLEVSYQLPNEAWRVLHQDYYSVSRRDWGELHIPPLRTITGVIKPAAQQELPTQAWIWENPESDRFHLLPLLPDDVLIHGDDKNWLLAAEPVSGIRAQSDLRRGRFHGVELNIDPNGSFEYQGRLTNPAVCVLDGDGRFHWFTPDGENWELNLLPLIDRRVRIFDDYHKRASGVYVASAMGGVFPDHQILREVGQYEDDGASGWYILPRNPTGFHAAAGRWQPGDPWYTWDWTKKDDFYLKRDGAFTLPRPREVTVHVRDEFGEPLTDGLVTITSSDFICDPQFPAFSATAFLSKIGNVHFTRVPPMNETYCVVQARGYYPLPIDTRKAKNQTEWLLKMAPLRTFEIKVTGSDFPAKFFPARVQLQTRGMGFPVIRWLSAADYPTQFASVCGSHSTIEIEGADGSFVFLEWDGETSEIIVSEAARWLSDQSDAATDQSDAATDQSAAGQTSKKPAADEKRQPPV